LGDVDAVSVPVTQQNVDSFDLFSSSGLSNDSSLSQDTVEGVGYEIFTSGNWRASDLMGDYVRVRGEDGFWVNFGYVSDLLVDDDAIIATMIASTSRYGTGTYAYPYPGNTSPGVSVWAPGAPLQDLPILVGDATTLPSLDAAGVEAN
jgi:hypothetical protein